ncbi:deoxyribose-phosphate aldolase, partial [Rhizobium sp. TRM95111]|nr:deoxyribose-phosphate aldolase [Rhizobium alarense]
MNETTTPRQVAAKALSLLDLTDLTDTCDTAAIMRLCGQAVTPFGHAAAICIWPRFVTEARGILGATSPVRIATVVNFPSGDGPVADVLAETRQAIEDGADEIDLVIPYRRLIAGDEATVREMILAVREACEPPVLLKTIIESG